MQRILNMEHILFLHHRYATDLDCLSFKNKTSRLQIRNSNTRRSTAVVGEIFALYSFEFQGNAASTRRERRVLEFGPRKR